MTDHTGQSKTRSGASCETISGVDENKANEMLEIGSPLGTFSAFNNCQSFVQDVIDAAATPERRESLPGAKSQFPNSKRNDFLCLRKRNRSCIRAIGFLK